MNPIAIDCWNRWNHARMVLASVLFALAMMGNAPAYAVSEDDMDAAKIQFQQAIASGDVQQARRILSGLDDGIARAVVFSTYSTRSTSMRKLESQNKPAVYEQMAVFLSSINANIIFGPDWNSSAPANGSISGRVKDDITSHGLAGVKVIVAGHVTVTDANGAFSFAGLPKGKFDLYMSAPGLSSFGDGPRIITASTGGRPWDLFMHNAAPKQAVAGTETIEGTVVDAQSGEPIVGAQFLIAPLKADASLARGAETDSQGRFTLTGVHTGISEISITPADILYHLPFGQKVNMSGGGKTHTVVWKLERTKGSMAIAAGAWVGKVLRADTEEPVKGARVGIGESWTTTDKDGRFTLALPDTGKSIGIEDLQQMDNLSPAEKRKAIDKLYAIMASGGTQPGDEPYVVNATHTNFSKFSGTYPANRDKKKEMIIHLDPQKIGNIEGIVVDAKTGKPVALATIQVQSQVVQSKPDGTFRFEKIHSGDLLLQAEAGSYHSAENRITLKPLGTLQIRFELEPITTGTVTGVAVNARDQKPLANVKVELGAHTVMTDAQGRFELKEIGAGDTTVLGSKAIFKPASQAVTVLAAKNVNVTLKLEPVTTGTVTGVAVNAVNQKPLAGVKVTLGTLSTTTDAQGRFKLLDVNSGDALVQGRKAVFKPASQGAKVVAAKNVNVTLKLEPITTGSISGIVVDKKTRKPILGVRVSVGGEADETDAKGHYSLERITAGNVVLISRHPDYTTDEQAFKLKASSALQKNVEMERRREDVVELENALRLKGTVDLYGIHFDSGKDQFKPSSLSTLQAVSEVIKGMQDNMFEISGHTDSDGQDAYNQNLSERRSRTVIKWLVDHGVNASQLKAKGYGESKPVVPNNTEAGKALNRRVQLRVLR